MEFTLYCYPICEQESQGDSNYFAPQTLEDSFHHIAGGRKEPTKGVLLFIEVVRLLLSIYWVLLFSS